MSSLSAPAPRRALVTGAASGIGRATAISLAHYGWQVALADVGPDALEQTRAELPQDADTLTHPIDVANESDIAGLVDTIATEWGGLDAVVHSAGIMRAQQVDIRDIDLDLWDQVIRVNLTGSFLVAKHAARLMIPAQAGVIVLIGSGGGVFGPSGSIPYGSSKGGVNGLGLTLDHQLRPHGIRVHTLCPSAVDTPMIQHSLDEGVRVGGSPEVAAATRAQLVAPEGIAEAIGLLIDPRARDLKGTFQTR